MNKRNLLIIILVILILVGGYFLYQYIQDLNYDKIYEKIEYWEEEELKDNEESIANKENDLSSDEEKAENVTKDKIVIHIVGEVINNGVFELDEGSRIIDAVNIAGGLTENADVSKINLAYILSDEMKIYIPNKNEEINKFIYESEVEYITNESGDNVIERNKVESEEEDILININKATQTELETLPGIGPSIALKIIEYREKNGNYTSIEDLKNVSGIGDGKFDKIKDLICV